jgi:hypothetical protein
MLCHNCRSIYNIDPTKATHISTEYYPEDGFNAHSFKASFKSLKSSAQLGCNCCLFFQNCIESESDFHHYKADAVEQASTSFTWFQDYESAGDHGSCGLHLSMPDPACSEVGGRNGGKILINLEFYTKEGLLIAVKNGSKVNKFIRPRLGIDHTSLYPTRSNFRSCSEGGQRLASSMRFLSYFLQFYNHWGCSIAAY